MERGAPHNFPASAAYPLRKDKPMPRFSFSAAFDRAALACAICLAALPVLTVVAGASIL